MTQDERTDRIYQSGQPLFHHHPLPADVPDRILNDTTRLMCAGTYLDPNYARAVIRELVEHEHRAVVPSVGFDLVRCYDTVSGLAGWSCSATPPSPGC